MSVLSREHTVGQPEGQRVRDPTRERVGIRTRDAQDLLDRRDGVAVGRPRRVVDPS